MVKFSTSTLSRQFVHICIISLIVALTFLPSLAGEFLNWDDHSHIVDNAAVRTFDLGQMFRQTVQKVYIPLTTLSFAVERKLFGLNPFVYHFDNVLLHVLNSILVYVIALRLGLAGRAAFVAGLLFGIHPMRVESVAWVTERKDLLYAFFYLMAMLQYLSFLKSRKWQALAGWLMFGVLSLLAKPMALSLPLVLFLLDWFDRRKFSLKIVLEKVPLVIIFVPIIWMTYMLHVRNPIQDWMEALLIWVWTFSFYIWKFIFPAVLVPVYNAPEPVGIHNPIYVCSAIFFAAVCLSVFRFKDKRWWVFSWAFYFLSIFFILRLDLNKDINIVADRFMYLPSLGFCLLIGLAVDFLFRKTAASATYFNIFAKVVVISVAVLLCLKSMDQTKIWNNTLSLWTHVIRYNPTEFLAYNDRAVGYISKKMYDHALADYGEILKFDPGNVDAHYNRGLLLQRLGKYRPAIEDFNRVIVQYPYYEKAYNNRGSAFESLGDDAMALADYSKTIEVSPVFTGGYLSRGNLFNKKGLFEQAMRDYQKVIDLDPANAMAFNNRGTVYAKLEQNDHAFEDFKRAIQLDPDYAEAYYNRSVIYQRRGQVALALEDAVKSRALGADGVDRYILELQNTASFDLGAKPKALGDK